MDPYQQQYQSGSMPEGQDGDRGLTDMLTNKLLQNYLGTNNLSSLGNMGGGAQSGNSLMDLLMRLLPLLTGDQGGQGQAGGMQALQGLLGGGANTQQQAGGMGALQGLLGGGAPSGQGMQNLQGQVMQNPGGFMQMLQQISNNPQTMQMLPPSLQGELSQLLQMNHQNPSALGNPNMSAPSNMPNKPSPNAIAPYGFPGNGQPASMPSTSSYPPQASIQSMPSSSSSFSSSSLSLPAGYPVNNSAPAPPVLAPEPPKPAASAIAPYGWPYAGAQQTTQVQYPGAPSPYGGYYSSTPYM